MNKKYRQGCLATTSSLGHSDIVSRSTDLCPAVLQAGAQVALTTIAARHQGCQTKCTRPSGVHVTMRVAEQDDVTGKMVLRQRNVWRAHATLSSRIRRELSG
jgi:hypothetical protein